jgi:serine/threonine-protein kinase
MSAEFHYLDPHTCAHVIKNLAKALHEAHKVGICHRDLKPSNIMVSNDFNLSMVKLTDFGIAKLAESEIESEIELLRKMKVP